MPAPPTRVFAIALLLGAALAGAPGCARRSARRGPGDRATAATAAVIDFRDGHVDPAGDAVSQAIRDAVSSRDLELRQLPHQIITSRFPALPEPEQRLKQLTTYAREAAFLVLVESRAQYQAAEGKRFRWLVHTRISGDRPDVEGAPLVTAIDIPVLISTAGDQPRDAVAAAAPAIGGQVASLLDSLLVEP